MSSKSKNKYLPTLVSIFRESGYDGASINQISQATGLGKASLYHHFPGGKEEMMRSVLQFLGEGLESTVIKALRSEGSTKERFEKMGEAFTAIYEGGEKPCVLAIVLLGNAKNTFHSQVKKLLQTWLDEMTKVLQEAGIDETQARQKSEEIAIGIQGSLILAQGLDNPTPFRRFIQSLPEKVINEAQH
ncbi:TetR/AcrR family transcriptional regulator [Cyanobacterium aponinum UTEX 3221]|uniref:TetR/AcrR family transcriptional regulator n=1 Tax=Cyanobacterium aponinum TaxID=379064 RepID=UPI002B4BC7BE|nr:TetR/AcrR family transcriptional regulator [Cyanobacterium aponinum]WRL38417.1 TetR/AcrR family transcriptional regulator [Cyanobacterium aponinum UTEX 3221]